jgi:hypothetical protein
VSTLGQVQGAATGALNAFIPGAGQFFRTALAFIEHFGEKLAELFGYDPESFHDHLRDSMVDMAKKYPKPYPANLGQLLQDRFEGDMYGCVTLAINICTFFNEDVANQYIQAMQARHGGSERWATFIWGSDSRSVQQFRTVRDIIAGFLVGPYGTNGPDQWADGLFKAENEHYPTDFAQFHYVTIFGLANVFVRNHRAIMGDMARRLSRKDLVATAWKILGWTWSNDATDSPASWPGISRATINQESAGSFVPDLTDWISRVILGFQRLVGWRQ